MRLWGQRKYQTKVRFVMEVAWQAHFVKNMFIRQARGTASSPDFVVVNAQTDLLITLNTA